MIYVTNHAPRLHTIALGATGTIRLAPGVNPVQPEAWEVAKRNPQVKQMLARGQQGLGLTAVEPVTTGASPVDPTLEGLSPMLAADLVQSTFDRKLLGAFKASEKRASVRAAIDLQLADLDARDKADAELAKASGNTKAKDSD